MHRLFCRVLVIIAALLLTLQASAQSSDDVAIEVAVVKPHPADVIHNNFSFVKNRFELENQSLLKMIAFAYSLNARQIVGAPGWVADGRWDMSGKTNRAADATLPQQQAIVRQLLVERFGLKFHEEKREMPAYALQVVKEHPKLPTAADPAAQPLEWTQGHDMVRTENYRSSTMADFLVIKQLLMDRPLVDQTGLEGRYDFKLSYSYGDAPATDADAPPPMFTAIKEQLGLKFEPVKTSVDVMVIDHVEKPTEN
jgi:uncharacterized protein (TIGR03435 family)